MLGHDLLCRNFDKRIETRWAIGYWHLKELWECIEGRTEGFGVSYHWTHSLLLVMRPLASISISVPSGSCLTATHVRTYGTLVNVLHRKLELEHNILA